MHIYHKVAEIYISAPHDNIEPVSIKQKNLVLNLDELKALKTKLQEAFRIVYHTHPSIVFLNDNGEEYTI